LNGCARTMSVAVGHHVEGNDVREARGAQHGFQVMTDEIFAARSEGFVNDAQLHLLRRSADTQTEQNTQRRHCVWLVFRLVNTLSWDS
jgi:hypothetical protein